MNIGNLSRKRSIYAVECKICQANSLFKKSRSNPSERKVELIANNALSRPVPTNFYDLSVETILHISSFLSIEATIYLDVFCRAKINKPIPNLLVEAVKEMGFERYEFSKTNKDTPAAIEKQSEEVEQLKGLTDKEKTKANKFFAKLRKEFDVLIKSLTKLNKHETVQKLSIKALTVSGKEEVDWKSSINNLKYIPLTNLFDLLTDKSIYQCPKILAFIIKHRMPDVPPPKIALYPEKTTERSHQALALAIQNGHSVVCRLLINLGVNDRSHLFDLLDVATWTNDSQLFNQFDKKNWRLNSEQEFFLLKNVCLNGNLQGFIKLKARSTHFETLIKNNPSLLHAAASGGNIQIATELLKWGIKVDALDGDNTIPLCDAAAYGHEEMVAFLLCQNANRNFKSPKNYRLIHFAAMSGNVNLVLLFLDANTINLPGHGNKTPLLIAGMKNHFFLVDVLISQGADPCMRDENGFSIVHYAAKFKQTQCLEYLIKRKPELTHLQSNEKGYSPLIFLLKFATKEDEDLVKTVKLLLDNKADPFMCDYSERTSLCYSLENGLVKITTLIFERGLPKDLNLRHYLYHALNHSKNVVFLKKFKTLGIDFNEHLPLCSCLLTYVINSEKPDSDKMILLSELLRLGANPFAADLSGSTPLSASLKKGLVDFSEERLKMYPQDDPNLVAHFYATLQHPKNVKLLKTFKELGVDFNYAKENCSPPLTYVIKSDLPISDKLTLLRELLALGADPNSPPVLFINSNSESCQAHPIIQAFQQGNKEIMEMFLSVRIDPMFYPIMLRTIIKKMQNEPNLETCLTLILKKCFPKKTKATLSRLQEKILQEVKMGNKRA